MLTNSSTLVTETENNKEIVTLTSKPDARVEEVFMGVDSSFAWDFGFRRNTTEGEVEELRLVLQDLQSVQIRRNSPDRRVWQGSPEGYTSKSFFQLLHPGSHQPFFQQFLSIWKSSVPHRVKVFAWLLAHGKLNTNDLVQRRNPQIQVSPSWCCLCRKGYETLNHLMLRCEFASDLWSQFYRYLGVLRVHPRDCRSVLIEERMGPGANGRAKVLWKTMVLSLLWSIWRERNARIFDDKERDKDHIFDNAKYSASLWASTNKAFKGYPFSMLVDDWREAIGL